MPFTLADIAKMPCAHRNKELLQRLQQEKEAMPGKKSKYSNVKVEVDGIKFDSAREAKRYKELKFLQEQGIISDLKLQVAYQLNEGGTHSLKYIADFVYVSDGVTIVEDCKGYETATYKKKERLMKKIHGITIKKT